MFISITAGGCKHAVAFLMWLHRRSEEPSPTEVTCYWTKSKLSKIGTSIKFLTLKDFGATSELSSDEDGAHFLKEVVDKGLETNSQSQLLKHFKKDGITENLGLYQLMLQFIATGQDSYPEFLQFCSSIMDTQLCSQAAEITQEQSKCGLWFELRYSRITASKIHEAAHCKTTDGTLVDQILGVNKFKGTGAMKRGRELESSVIKCLEKHLKVKYRHIGLQLSKHHPIFGASPDAICDEYVVEVKCPQSRKTVANYLNKNNEITAKYKAQVQLQMFLLNKKKVYFALQTQNFKLIQNSFIYG